MTTSGMHERGEGAPTVVLSQQLPWRLGALQSISEAENDPARIGNLQENNKDEGGLDVFYEEV